MIKRTTNTLTSHIIVSILVQSLAYLEKVLGLDTVAEKESEKVKELHFQIELEIRIRGSNFVKLKTIFGLK